MRFTITRTGAWYKKPIKEAYRISIPCWDERTCTEVYYDKHIARDGKAWRNHGKNHKKTNGGKWIARQMDDQKAWAIDISSLDDLIKLYEKYGDIILGKESSTNEEKIYQLEVYDSYRE